MFLSTRLNIYPHCWMIEDMVVLPTFSCSLSLGHYKAITENMVHNCGPYFIRNLSMSLFYLFLCFASLPFHQAAVLLFFFPDVDPVHFLLILPLVKFLTLCCALSICLIIKGSWDAPLSYFGELTWEEFNNSGHIYNRQEKCLFYM